MRPPRGTVLNSVADLRQADHAAKRLGVIEGFQAVRPAVEGRSVAQPSSSTYPRTTKGHEVRRRLSAFPSARPFAGLVDRRPDRAGAPNQSDIVITLINRKAPSALHGATVAG